jgi:predicted AlkP superfamily phosphohydrolase/phosphomutase
MNLWDGLIGKFLSRYHDLPEPKRLLVMADHGFTSLVQEVDLNAWLRDQGLLRLSRQPVSEWDAGALGPDTRAFALDPGRIYLHTRERFARGSLTGDEADRLGAELASALTRLTWQRRAVIRHAYRGQDLYRGAKAHLAPDLVLVPQPGFDLKGKFGRRDMFGHFGRQGMHTADDVFFCDSMGSSPGTPTEVGQIILQHFDISPATLKA